MKVTEDEQSHAMTNKKVEDGPEAGFHETGKKVRFVFSYEIDVY